MEQREQPRLLQRRVATAPTLLQSLPRTSRSGEKIEGDDGTLFDHANAKVISLVALSDQTFSLDSSNRDPIGPWQSHFERTIAIGSLKLYRAPGSVAFLSCGSVLQPMFPKSQCWCMEEDGSKFILQIRPPSYWRIELASPQAPGSSLRDCLESVLLLDKTPCPFKESVPILLPPESPPAKKRRPWKPLRSYPSEPILAKESGNLSGESQLFKGGLDRDAMAEYQGDSKGAVVQEDDQSQSSCIVTKGPAITAENMPHRTVEDETSSGGVLESRSRTLDQLRDTEDTPSLAESQSSSEGTSCHTALDVEPVNAQSLRVLANASESCIDMAPCLEKETLQEKPDEIRGMRCRRYTVAASGNGAELDVLIQRASGGMQSQEPLSRWDSKTRAEVGVVLGKNASSSGTMAQGTSQQTPRLRLRCKELREAAATPPEGHMRDSLSSEALPSASQAGLLPKAIFILLYTILRIVTVGLRVAGTVVVSWRKPIISSTEDAQCNNANNQRSKSVVPAHITDLDVCNG